MLFRRSLAPTSATRSLRHLRATFTTPLALSHRIRYFSSSPVTSNDAPNTTVAIVGGGLSGLSSAFYFLKALTPEARKSTKVVIFEKEKRTGGWCHSVPVSLQGGVVTKSEEGHSMIFETGPRSIRPVGLQGWLTVELAHSLGLTSELITVPKTAPSAKNRFVYYPSSLTLLPSSLPSSIVAAFTKPIIRSAIPGILLEPFRPTSSLHTLPDGGDESVDSFFKRRFGKPLAENMISAMIHGIYSGDTRRLSVRAVFPGLWELEREWGSVVKGAMLGGLWRKYKKGAAKSKYRVEVEKQEEQVAEIKTRLSNSEEGRELVESMEMASVWGLKGGLQRLTEAIRLKLVEDGVQVRTGADGDVTGTQFKDGEWTVTTPTSSFQPTYLITSNPFILPTSLQPPPIPSTTVSVVNLAFPSEPALFPPGFGYLIPRTVSPSKNPHHALGVIFDSDVMPSLDSSSSAGLTKISMLLGGSYWLDQPPTTPPPSHKTLVGWAMETLRLHYPETKFPEPVHTLTHTHKNCIAQVPVGYGKELKKFGDRLRGVGGVAVAGGGTGTIGVNGAVKGAWEVGTSLGKKVSGEAGEALTGVEMWR
ncbi:protoporphyrinogen/coproporphyrinogen III oxidase, partial [Phenoliferia sp. Uapishka_3]